MNQNFISCQKTGTHTYDDPSSWNDTSVINHNLLLQECEVLYAIYTNDEFGVEQMRCCGDLPLLDLKKNYLPFNI